MTMGLVGHIIGLPARSKTTKIETLYSDAASRMRLTERLTETQVQGYDRI